MMVSPAYAQGGFSLGGEWMQFVPLILIGVVFYFFLIRPQQKKAQTHRDMLLALRRGDKIVTNGGLIGTIIKVVNEREVQIEISENVRVRVMRGMIADVLAKTEPQGEDEEMAMPSLAHQGEESSVPKKSIGAKKSGFPLKTTTPPKKKN